METMDMKVTVMGNLSQKRVVVLGTTRERKKKKKF
jgi:hypothetical protein